MTNAGGDPGADNGAEIRPEVSLPNALNTGEEYSELVDQRAGVFRELTDLEARRRAIEERHERDLAQVEAFHEIELVELDDERSSAIRRRDELQAEVKSYQGSVSHYKGRLRTLASKPDALRGDQLLYASFATNGDTSREGLDAIAAVDDTVRENGGEVFVAVQDGNLSFGRIREDNEGLLIDTSLENSPADDKRRVRLPVQPYALGDSETSHAYGWVSGNFDEIEHDYTYDPVLNRSKDDDDKIRGAGVYCKVQTEDSNLHLTDPTDLRVLEEFEGVVDAELILGRDHEGFMLTGEAASEFLHEFIDSRLLQVSEWDRNAAAKEASRWPMLASQLGVSIDLTKLKRFKPDFGDI